MERRAYRRGIVSCSSCLCALERRAHRGAAARRGIGWSLAQIASAALLEKAESPTRSQLALHDTLIFVSALASLLAA